MGLFTALDEVDAERFTSDPERRAEVEALRARQREALERTYGVVYTTARTALEEGERPEVTRELLMGQVQTDGVSPAVVARSVANVEAALSDALSLKPPRYTRGFNREDETVRRWLEG